jgi:hypothetical protein
MKKNTYRRLEELERLNAAVLETRAYRLAGQSGEDWLREVEINYGIKQLAGESRADALARSFGVSSRELKDLLYRRCSASDDADRSGWSG